MEKYKLEILSVDDFLLNRPDMVVHEEKSIKSCIYSAAGILNAETMGNIDKVWTFNREENRDKTNELYRDSWELSQLKEAFIVQTQYMLNMGNDLSIGGGSYSIGDINSSFSRPSDRSQLAPSVQKLLANARVYSLVSIASDKNSVINSDNFNCLPTEIENKVKNKLDTRYVRIHQANAKEGEVLWIDKDKNVSTKNPQELTFAITKADMVKCKNGDYYELERFPELAFYGIHDTNAITRGEVKKLIEGGITFEWGQLTGNINNQKDLMEEFKKDRNELDNQRRELARLHQKDNEQQLELDDHLRRLEKLDTSQREQDEKIKKNTNDIKDINTQLGNVNGNITNINSEVAKLKEEQVVQNTNIQNNTNKNNEQDTKINQNTTKIDKLIEELRKSNIINYVGQWNSTTTYKLGQVVSHQDKLYLCKVATSLNKQPDTNKVDWDLLSAPEINLDHYVTDQELQQAIQKIEQEIEKLNNKYTQLDNKFANYVNKTTNEEVSGTKTFTNKMLYKSAQTYTNDREIVDLGEVKNRVAQGIQAKLAWGNITGTLSNQTDLQNALNAKANSADLAKKQDKLVAGANITINGNTISATGGGTTTNAIWGQISGTLTNQTDLNTVLNSKVDLTSTQTITGQKTFNSLWSSDPKFNQISDSNNSTTIGVGNQTLYKVFKYNNDYSSSFVENSLVSKKYVDTKIASNVPTLPANIAKTDVANTFVGTQYFKGGINLMGTSIHTTNTSTPINASSKFNYLSNYTSFSSNEIPSAGWVQDYVKNNAGGGGIGSNTTQVFSRSTTLSSKNNSSNSLGSISPSLQSGKLYLVHWNFYGGGNSWDTYGEFLMTIPNNNISTWKYTITKATSNDNGSYVYEVQLEISKSSVYCTRYDRHSQNPTLSVTIYELN